MKKTRITDLAKEAGVHVKEALEMARKKLSSEMMSGKGGATWLTPEGAELLRSSLIIEEAVPAYKTAKVLRPAPNSKYVFAVLEGGMKVPVFVPPQKRGHKLKGKNITVEVIEDVNGISYCYVRTGR